MILIYAAFAHLVLLIIFCNVLVLILNFLNPATRLELNKPLPPGLIFGLLCIPGVMLSGAALRICDNPVLPIICIFAGLGLIGLLIVWRDQRKAADLKKAAGA